MRQPEHRKHDRDSLFLVAELRLEPGGAPYAVKLRNISASGAMAEGAMRVSRGSPVWIDLCNIGVVSGNVAWAAGNRCGIAFEQTIEASQVRYPVEEIDLPQRDADVGGAEVGNVPHSGSRSRD